MIREGGRAPDVTLLDTSGVEIPIAELTAKGPSVFFFLRHYA